MKRNAKVCPLVLRQNGPAREVLVFRHPQAGAQIVKGTPRAGEPLAETAIRALARQSGIRLTTRPHDIGTHRVGTPGEDWRMFLSEGQDMPDRWVWQVEGGPILSFFWHRIHAAPGPDWRIPSLHVLYRLRDWIEYRSGDKAVPLPPAPPPSIPRP